MVRDTSGSSFADEFDKYQADRRIVNCLTIIRCANGVSQVELGRRMDCAQSKISRMESSTDAELSFGDIINFALALQQSIQIKFAPARNNGADHIRFHLDCIKLELHRLVKIAGDDKAICNGVEELAIETVESMVDMIEKALDKLPRRVQQTVSPVSVEAEGARGQRLQLDAPRNVRRRSKSPQPA